MTGIGEHLHPNVHFKSPQGETTGKEALLAGVQRIFPVLMSYEIRSTFASGDQVVAIYNFNCVDPIGTCRTAELLTFQDGQIIGSELFFDPRPFEKLAQRKN